jgi:hypothetical protein
VKIGGGANLNCIDLSLFFEGNTRGIYVVKLDIINKKGGD